MSFANLDTRIEFDECVRLALCKPQQMLRAPVHTQLAKRRAARLANRNILHNRFLGTRFRPEEAS